MNINKNYIIERPISFKGHRPVTAEMMAFSSQDNRKRFLIETESVRKKDLIDGQSPLSFLKERAKEILNVLNEGPSQKSIKNGLDLIG